MKYVDFRKFTDEKGAQAIYLFEGEEAYFRDKGEMLLKSRYLSEPTLDYASFDGAKLKGDALLSLVSAVNSFPFVSERRIVRVTEFYPTEKDYETYLKGLFENPPESSILLILNESKAKTGQVNLSKKPNVTHVECGRSDLETIKRWIYLTFKKEGVYVDGVTSGKLAEYCVLDMARIASETEKLLGYCQATQQTKVTDEIVDDLVYPDSEYKIYELANALSRKNYSTFIKILTELQTKGFNEHTILSSLCSYFKGLYDVASARGSDSEIAQSLGLKEYAVKKNREQASKFTQAQLFTQYQKVYEVISEVKSGKTTPDSALKKVTAWLFFGKS